MVKNHYWKIGTSNSPITNINGSSVSMKTLIFGKMISCYKNGNHSDLRENNIKNIRGYKNDGKTFLNGYIAIYMPEHKRAFNKNGCVYEHILVAEKILGRELNEHEVVHHIDKDRMNNSEDNLMVFATDKDHISFHATGEAIKTEEGNYISTKLRFVYKYNNRTKKDIDNKINDEGSVTIFDSEHDLCPICNKRLKYKNAKMCRECYDKNRIINIPKKEDLEKLIYNTPFTKIGAIYGVSDNTVRKWCKKYGLPFRKKDMKNNENR